MPTQSQSRIGYLLRSMEFSQISAQTMIPTATLSAVYKGEYRLPSMYTKPLRNLYQRSTYHDLRSQGLSPTQARRFQWYGAKTVVQVETQAVSTVQTLVDRRIDNYIASLKRKGMYTTASDAQRTLFSAIQNAISRSKLPTERLNELVETGETGVPASKNKTRRKGVEPEDDETDEYKRRDLSSPTF